MPGRLGAVHITQRAILVFPLECSNLSDHNGNVATSWRHYLDGTTWSHSAERVRAGIAEQAAPVSETLIYPLSI